MSTSRSLIISCLLVTMFMVPLVGADASYYEDIGDGLEVDISPLRLTLANGEEGVFEIKVRNNNNETYYVLINILRVKSPGGSSARVEPSYQPIGPRSTGTFRVTVTSGATRGQDGDISDIRFHISWSSVDDPDMDENGSAEGGWNHTYDIVDDFSEQTTWVVVILVFGFLGLLVLVLALRRRGRPQAPPSHEGPGEKH